ncbi:MAG: sugar ABC transporter substrate-binding protein [Clostridium sp.]|nr:sugar ABC transporter substrate-binding protein [Clostridium sp.]
MKKIIFILLIIFISAILAVLFLPQNKDKRTVIKFSSWGSQTETDLLKPLFKKFEKENPEIKIEFVHIPQNYFQKLHLLFASNLAPDVVFINNYFAPKYVKAELLEDLSPYFDKKDYFEKSYQGFEFDGKIYAIPRDVSNVVVYYNKDLFKKYNVPLPAQNWSMKEYVEAAKKLTKDTNNDGKTDLWGTSFEKDIIYWLPFLLSNGASILSEDGETIKITDTNALDSIDFYSSLVNKYKIAPSKSDNASLTMAQLFLQKRLAMHISGRWLVPKYREEADFDWDIALFPSGTKGSVVNIDASGYALSKSSQHKEEAIKFIQFISSKNSLEELSKSGLIIPARKDAAYSEVFLEKNKKPDHAKYFLNTIETGIPTQVNENYQTLTDRLGIILEPVFLGKKKARDVIEPELSRK